MAGTTVDQPSGLVDVKELKAAHRIGAGQDVTLPEYSRVDALNMSVSTDAAASRADRLAYQMGRAITDKLTQENAKIGEATSYQDVTDEVSKISLKAGILDPELAAKLEEYALNRYAVGKEIDDRTPEQKRAAEEEKRAKDRDKDHPLAEFMEDMAHEAIMRQATGSKTSTPFEVLEALQVPQSSDIGHTQGLYFVSEASDQIAGAASSVTPHGSILSTSVGEAAKFGLRAMGSEGIAQVYTDLASVALFPIKA